jgi:DNA-binding HxlR family transcriptional regulator
MNNTRNHKAYHCPVEAALDVIGGKWKPLIIWHLGNDVLRFGELQKKLPGVNAKMLTKQLRELEEDGVVRREVYPEVPPRVDYSITEFGKTLFPIMEALCEWGAQYLDIPGNGEGATINGHCRALVKKQED